MEVQFLDLKKAYLELKTEFDQLWQDINDNSFYILGNKLKQFEEEFAKFLNVKHVIGVANGLDALSLSFRALDIGLDDEVIVPAHTYIASWLAVSQVGAVPVPVEIDESSYLLDSNKIQAAITDKTKAIMPVHLYGRVCDMNSILEIARQHNLKVIEDAAQAHGATDNITGKKAGSFGNCNAFSFYPGKNLGCFGDGGCISTNDDELADKLRLLRNYGSRVRYEHEIIGCNSRLDELQAGVLSIKLKYLDEWNKRRQDIARIYLEELRNVKEIILPEYDQGSVWHLFVIKTSKRDELQKYLSYHGISTIIHYPKPIYLQKAYQYMSITQDSFPVTETLSAQALSIPIGPHLKKEEMKHVVSKIKRFFSS